MAFLIDLKGEIKKVEPKNRYFDVDDIRKLSEGWFIPDKVGPIWMIYNEDLNDKKNPDDFNSIASAFFMRELYGKIVILTSYEMPNDWDIKDDEDLQYTHEEIESGFSNLFSKFLLSTYSYHTPNMDAFTHNPTEQKSHFLFKPNDVNYPNVKNPHEFKEFLRSSYDFIINSYEKNSDNFTMIEDDSMIIKVKSKKDQIMALEYVISILEEDEEYEKCANLSKIKSKIENTLDS